MTTRIFFYQNAPRGTDSICYRASTWILGLLKRTQRGQFGLEMEQFYLEALKKGLRVHLGGEST